MAWSEQFLGILGSRKYETMYYDAKYIKQNFIRAYNKFISQNVMQRSQQFQNNSNFVCPRGM